MKVGEICSRDVLTAETAEPLAKCARQMKERNVGSVVVVEKSRGYPRPLGILTDRDVVRGQFDRKADLFCLSAADVMTNDPMVLDEDTGVSDAIQALARWGVRRAPVVNGGGALVGIVTFDDMLPGIAAEMTAIARIITGQVEKHRRQR